MGIHNYKLVQEYFEFYPNTIPGGPVKREPDPFTLYGSLVSQLAQRVSELTVVVGAMQQNLAQGQHAFTQAAPMAAPPGTEAAGVADEVRKLSQRMDDLESRTAKV